MTYIGQAVTWSSPKLGIELVGTVIQERQKRARVPSKDAGFVVWETTTQTELFVEWPADGPEDCWFTPGDSIIRLRPETDGFPESGDDEWFVKVAMGGVAAETIRVHAPDRGAAERIAAKIAGRSVLRVIEATRVDDLF